MGSTHSIIQTTTANDKDKNKEKNTSAPPSAAASNTPSDNVLPTSQMRKQCEAVFTRLAAESCSGKSGEAEEKEKAGGLTEGTVSKDVFESHLTSPPGTCPSSFATRIYGCLTSQPLSTTAPSESFTLPHLLTALTHLSEPTLNHTTLLSFFDPQKKAYDPATLQTLLKDMYTLSSTNLASTNPTIDQEDPTPFLDSVTHQVFQHAYTISSSSPLMLNDPPETCLNQPLPASSVAAVTQKYLPRLFDPVRELMLRKFAGLDGDPGAAGFAPAVVVAGEKSEVVTVPMVWLLANAVVSGVEETVDGKVVVKQQANWELLYCGQRHVDPSPTLLLISGTPRSKPSTNSNSTPQQILIGAYIDTPWKSHSRTFFGGPECTVFELLPRFDVYRSTAAGDAKAKPGGTGPTQQQQQQQNHVYCSTEKGVIGFGGVLNQFILSTDLRTGTYRNDPLAPRGGYEPCRTRGGFEVLFDVDDVEVFGLGTPTARTTQQTAWAFDARDADRRANVNLGHGKEEARRILEMAGVATYSEGVE
ncbi:Restriction of telomere capping protein 5 [Borealophlyctis nickersoniae]|nr:Restriction of telomere capping protein 5 [Borealophlyctis nickersoniae]